MFQWLNAGVSSTKHQLFTQFFNARVRILASCRYIKSNPKGADDGRICAAWRYLAIIPVVLAVTYPALNALNVLRFTSVRSAIVSAVIFNTLIIVPLVILAMRSVKARAQSSPHSLRSSLWTYGLGGFLLPWLGIKLIDVGIATLGFVRQS
jgi:hypothetical protein